MILAAEGKPKEAAAAYQRYIDEVRERPLRHISDDPCVGCDCFDDERSRPGK